MMINLINERWQPFRLGDLFEISRPEARKKSSYEDGTVPFVASGRFNNGVMKLCTPLEGETLDKGKCITVSPVDGYAFYQDKDFLGRGGAGSSIIILRNENLNKYTGMFIATVIRAECNYSYNDMGQSDLSKDKVIHLPSKISAEKVTPDWTYMEEFMKSICDTSEKRYKEIIQLIQ